MANNKSAKKRIQINERNRLKNRFYKGNIESVITASSLPTMKMIKPIKFVRKMVTIKN